MQNTNANTDLCIEFSGEAHELDVNVLLTSLLNFSAAIQEIKDSISPETKIEIKVKPFGEGSFLLLLGLYAPELIKKTLSLFGKEDIALGAQIISIFANCIKLKEFLKGKPPKDVSNEDKDGNINISNQNGDIIQFNKSTINIYLENPKLDRLYSKAFESIHSEQNIEGIKISDSQGQVLTEVPGASFDYMANDIQIDEPLIKIVPKNGAIVQATKLSFEQGYTWGFVYEGNKINAKITDESFFARINNNERFAKGDTFAVNLEITQKYDSEINAYINKAYEITAVLEHKEADKQSSLF